MQLQWKDKILQYFVSYPVFLRWEINMHKFWEIRIFNPFHAMSQNAGKGTTSLCLWMSEWEFKKTKEAAKHTETLPH